MKPGDDLEIRAARPDDRAGVIALLAASMRQDDDPRFGSLFAWKHEQNAFGPSPAWVAVDGDRLVGYRALMRWRFDCGGRTVEAVRAVDTATHPRYQGRGIFTRLTLHGLDELRAARVGFVFNTPNGQSRPGYLKMGWRVVGRLPISVRPRSLLVAPRLAQARVPAKVWSEACVDGEPAANVLQQTDAVGNLLASQPPSPGVRTARTPEYLQWRYGSSPLGYRVIVAEGSPEAGIAIFRVRRRGAAREAVLDEVIVPGADPRLARAMRGRVGREVDADYVIRIGGPPVASDGYVRLPRQGPILTWRSICETRMPALDSWDVTLGDIELF